MKPIDIGTLYDILDDHYERLYMADETEVVIASATPLDPGTVATAQSVDVTYHYYRDERGRERCKAILQLNEEAPEPMTETELINETLERR